MEQTIFKKLMLDKFQHKAILNCPSNLDLFDGIDYDQGLKKSNYDLLIIFIFSLEEFVSNVQQLISGKILNDGGVIYFAYPKKGNKQYDTYIGRDDFLEVINMDDDGYIDQSTIKFNKMVALNDIFTILGLKNVKRGKKSNQPSQCVSAYVDRLPELEKMLSNNKTALSQFQMLTPGYQRGWARYVFGVKSADTVNKHLEEMIQILGEGYKSIDLYRQAKK